LFWFFFRSSSKINGWIGIESKNPVDWVILGDGEDWLLRPVLEGLCKFESLIDCTLDLEHIAKMNDALDVKAENERRYSKANPQ
jgi:hypothetical protein